MNNPIHFTSGEYQIFIATRTFSLGDTGTSILAGSELEYDGTNIRYSGAAPVRMPQLRGAVKAGWIVLSDDYDPTDLSASIPRPAGVQVRDARGGNPMDPSSRSLITTVEAEEREVSNVAQHANQVQSRNKQARSQRSVSQDQDGMEVRKLSTPARQTTNFADESPDEAIRRANSVRIEAGQGRSRESMLASMTADEQSQYLDSIESRRSNHVAPRSNLVVGRVQAPQNQDKEGFRVTNQVGGGVEIADAGGMQGDVVETQTSQEGLTFRNTNVGLPKKKQARAVSTSTSDQDIQRRIAKSICRDFPDNYLFSDTPRKKIARLQADYEDRPDVIRAVAAADQDPDVRSRLLSEFPSAFGG